MKKQWIALLFWMLALGYGQAQTHHKNLVKLLPPSQMTDAQVVDNCLGIGQRAQAFLQTEIVTRGDAAGVMDELCKALGDEDRSVRLAAASLMGILQSSKATPCLSARFGVEQDRQVLVWLVQNAGNIGDPAFVPALKDLYAKVSAETPGANTRTASGLVILPEMLKSQIILALGKCKCAADAVPAFHQDAVAMTGQNRSLAYLGLALMGDPGIYDLIVPIMKAKRPGNTGDWDMDVLAATGSTKDIPLLSVYAPGGPLDQIRCQMEIKDLPADQKVARLIQLVSTSSHGSAQKWAVVQLGILGTPAALAFLKDVVVGSSHSFYFNEALVGLRKNGKHVTWTYGPNGWPAAYSVQ